MQLWADLLQETDSISSAVETAQQKSDSAAALLKKNLLKAVEATKNLERSYRSVALFYKNTESDKLKNITLMNADPEQLKDLDNPRFIDAVSGVLKASYDRLD